MDVAPKTKMSNYPSGWEWVVNILGSASAIRDHFSPFTTGTLMQRWLLLAFILCAILTLSLPSFALTSEQRTAIVRHLASHPALSTLDAPLGQAMAGRDYEAAALYYDYMVGVIGEHVNEASVLGEAVRAGYVNFVEVHLDEANLGQDQIEDAVEIAESFDQDDIVGILQNYLGDHFVDLEQPVQTLAPRNSPSNSVILEAPSQPQNATSVMSEEGELGSWELISINLAGGCG
jgi:hypothetical protein